jgi:hypothetical protein
MSEQLESGEDKREFAEVLQADWQEFGRAKKTMTGVPQLEQNRRVYSVEGVDAVI